MFQLLRYVSRRRRNGRFGLQEDTWRQVPKINLLAARRRGPTSTSVVTALLAVLLVEVILLVVAYRGLASAQDAVDKDRRESQRVQQEEAQASARVQELFQRIEQLQAPKPTGSSAEGALQEIARARVDWSAFLTALFETEATGITFQEVSTQPDSGRAQVLGTATDISAIVGFQAQIGKASDTLQLLSLRWKGGKQSLEFEAAFSVKESRSGE